MTERRKPPKARGTTGPRNGHHRTAVLLEEIRSQMRVVVERALGTPSKREFAELKEDLGSRLDRVETRLDGIDREVRGLRQEVARNAHGSELRAINGRPNEKKVNPRLDVAAWDQPRHRIFRLSPRHVGVDAHAIEFLEALVHRSVVRVKENDKGDVAPGVLGAKRGKLSRKVHQHVLRPACVDHVAIHHPRTTTATRVEAAVWVRSNADVAPVDAKPFQRTVDEDA
jgi:hypothetical protein